MQIVIDVPDKLYTHIQHDNAYYLEDGECLYTIVKNGIPLPKGHGRLIDAEELKKDYPHDEDWDYPVNTNSYVVESIDNAPTIIEADGGDTDAKQ